MLVTGTWDGKRHTWDVWPHKPNKPTELVRGTKAVGHENRVTSVAVNRHRNLLACACSAGCVLVYRAECPTISVEVQEADELQLLQDALKIGEFSELLLTESIEIGGVPLEQNYELLQEADFAGHSLKREVNTLAIPARLHFRFSGCITRGRSHAWLQLEHEASVLCMALSAENCLEFLYSGSRDRTVKKWSLVDGCCVHVYRGHGSMVRCLAVNGQYLATGSDDRSVRIWQRDTAAELRTMAGHRDFVRAVSLCSTFQQRLASSGDDHQVILWDVSKGERLATYTYSSVVSALVLREAALITACDDGWLRIASAEGGVLEKKLKHPGGVTALWVP